MPLVFIREGKEEERSWKSEYVCSNAARLVGESTLRVKGVYGFDGGFSRTPLPLTIFFLHGLLIDLSVWLTSFTTQPRGRRESDA